MRITLVFLTLILGTAVLRAEETYQRVPDREKTPPTMVKEDFKRGQMDKDGNLIFLTLHHSTKGTRNIAMKGDYGTMIFFDESTGKDRYEFYSKKDKRILKSDTLDEFLRLVGGMPRGSRLDLYNLCLAGTHYGYPQAKWERIEASCKEAGVRFDLEESTSICTCEEAKD
jgi:hypothetical protein